MRTGSLLAAVVLGAFLLVLVGIPQNLVAHHALPEWLGTVVGLMGVGGMFLLAGAIAWNRERR